MLHFVEHDKTEDVIPSTLFCHSERSEESIAWMLRSAQHDKSGKHGCFTSFSMTNWWMLHFVQHDKTEDVIPNTLFCHSERSEESIAWMLALRSA